MQVINRLINVAAAFCITAFILASTSCKKLIEVDSPVTSTNAANVYTSDATAAAVLTSIYSKISLDNYDLGNGSFTTISLFAGLSADELTLFNLNDTRLPLYYTNNLSSISSTGNFWGNIYPLIFTANSAIEGLNNSSSLTPQVKQQLLGEAKFFRAFSYLYLVNLYGDVPLVLNADYKLNAQMLRTPRSQVYQQIVLDLKEAQGLLSADFLKSDAMSTYPAGTEQRVRPTKWAATALLARVYLYMADYPNAEAQATTVISNSKLFSLPVLANVFKMNSIETIWSLQPVRSGSQSNTGEGAFFILPNSGPNNGTNPVYLSKNVVNSFEAGDQRLNSWVGKVTVLGTDYYFPSKYKINLTGSVTGEYIMVMRLSEQYLIRSEARAQQGSNLTGAAADLDSVRVRAKLPPTTATTQPTLLTAVQHERQVELFTEWGNRWFDLRRTNTIDAVMGTVAPQKGGSWSSYKAWYPIPQTEINLDGNLSQNSGYK